MTEIHDCGREGCSNTTKVYKSRKAVSNGKFYCSKECYSKDKLGTGNNIEYVCDLPSCENKSILPLAKYKQTKYHYCSNKCKKENRLRMNWYTFTCSREGCDGVRTIRNSSKSASGLHFCDVSCATLHRAKKKLRMVKFICDLDTCGKEASRPLSQFKEGAKHYCNATCYQEAHRIKYPEIKLDGVIKRRDGTRLKTFTCQRAGCDNVRTMHQSLYDSYSKHVCSKECLEIMQAENRVTYVCDDDNCHKVKTVYKKAYDKVGYHYCSKECSSKNVDRNRVHKRYGHTMLLKNNNGNQIITKENRKEEFIKRWKDTMWK